MKICNIAKRKMEIKQNCLNILCSLLKHQWDQYSNLPPRFLYFPFMSVSWLWSRKIYRVQPKMSRTWMQPAVPFWNYKAKPLHFLYVESKGKSGNWDRKLTSAAGFPFLDTHSSSISRSSVVVSTRPWKQNEFHHVIQTYRRTLWQITLRPRQSEVKGCQEHTCWPAKLEIFNKESRNYIVCYLTFNNIKRHA